MVGGKVIEVIDLPKKIWVNVQDRTYASEKAAVYIEKNENSQQIKNGDSIWWQGNDAYWTAKPNGKEDVKIPRLSYSGVDRPEGY